METKTIKVIISIIIFFVCNSFIPMKELQYYSFDPNPFYTPYITSEDIKYYWDHRSRTDTMYSIYLDLSRRELSLFDSAWSLLLPNENSPFFKYDTKTGSYILHNECTPQSYIIDKYLHIWIDFIISYSRTYEMKGYGPSIILEGNGGKSEINYSQLLAALTWYKLNSKYMSPNAFLFYSSSRNGEDWYSKALYWILKKDLSEQLHVEIPLDLLCTMVDEEVKMRDSLSFSIDVFPIFRIYNIPQADKRKYIDYQNSLISPFSGVTYDIHYL